MINEEKVRAMTRLTIYEEGKGKNFIPIGEYYKSDYVFKRMTAGFFSGTIAFAIIALLAVSYGFDSTVNSLVSLDLNRLIMIAVLCYLVFMLFYMGACYIICAKMYKKAEKSLKSYERALKRLENMYE